MEWINKLAKLGACKGALVFARKFKTFQEAWNACERADWMLWYLAKTEDRKHVVKIACQCARTALRFVPRGETRPLRAIETAEAWVEGKATLAEVRNAAIAAHSAAANAAAFAAYAADAAVDAADAANAVDADDAAHSAANAAAFAAYAADAANAAYAANAALVRQYHPNVE